MTTADVWLRVESARDQKVSLGVRVDGRNVGRMMLKRDTRSVKLYVKKVEEEKTLVVPDRDLVGVPTGREERSQVQSRIEHARQSRVGGRSATDEGDVTERKDGVRDGGGVRFAGRKDLLRRRAVVRDGRDDGATRTEGGTREGVAALWSGIRAISDVYKLKRNTGRRLTTSLAWFL